MEKAVVGMSGGVDSAVAAYLLKEQGYDVIGLTVRTWDSESGDSRCCEIDDARLVCKALDIPYNVVNAVSDFKNTVTDPFIESYRNGITPNPCINCNRYVKWDRMINWADITGARYVATGHYASVIALENGRYTVRSAKHREKDQTYMLYKLSQEQLKRTLMPLGDLDKETVRDIAHKAGLHIAEKKDSQEICFVTDGNYADYIKEHTGGADPAAGNFVDIYGNILGTHNGIINYTVGQRKGLGIALGYPAYVKKIDAFRNEVVLCSEDEIYTCSIRCGDTNFMSISEPSKGDSFTANVKIRYRHEAVPAIVTVTDHDDLLIEFSKPVRSPAPGQSAVFYDDSGCVIGGGVILPS